MDEIIFFEMKKKKLSLNYYDVLKSQTKEKQYFNQTQKKKISRSIFFSLGAQCFRSNLKFNKNK